MKITKRQSTLIAGAIETARVHETPTELAKRLGISAATVYSLATGNLRRLRSKTIQSIDLNLGLRLQNVESVLPELDQLKRQAEALKMRLETAGLRSNTERRGRDRRLGVMV